MLTKTVAAFAAILLTLGLSLAAASPANAATDGWPRGGDGQSSHRGDDRRGDDRRDDDRRGGDRRGGDDRRGDDRRGDDRRSDDRRGDDRRGDERRDEERRTDDRRDDSRRTMSPTPPPSTAPTPRAPRTPSAEPTPHGTKSPSSHRGGSASNPVERRSHGAKQGSSSSTTKSSTRYGIAAYVYRKLDARQPASWENSGPQRLVYQQLDRTTKASYLDRLELGLLPSDVCGSGWGVQQDLVAYTGAFSFPATITPPHDNIGWPPLYAATHVDLESLVTVPPCVLADAEADAEVVVTPATCAAPATVELGAIRNASWGTLSATSGPARYAVTATADTGFAFADGGTTATFAGELSGPLPATDPACGSRERCVPASAVSYNYDPASNSGVITVPRPSGTSGALCEPFWVTATSWTYLGTGHWPQKRDIVQTLGAITSSGSYPFVAAVGCGQGDIYASFDEAAPTLDPTDYLWGPDNPFDERFLHEMGFTGPKPTYTSTAHGCNVVTAQPASLPATCTAPGQYTLPAVDHVTWWVDGAETSPGSYPASAGTSVTITATTDEGTVLEGGKFSTKTYRWSYTWAFDYATPPGGCADLTGTTATGVCENDSPWIVYRVVLNDPHGEVTDRDAAIVLTDGTRSETIPLGTVGPAGVLEGRALWPGASVDPVTGEATGWPGWVQRDGVWQTTDDPAHYGWTRAVTTATIDLNPHIDVALSYPEASPDCATRPSNDPPTLGLFPTAAQLSAQCTPDGRATLTLGQVDGVSFFDDVDYFIDGVRATSSTISLSPGDYEVTAAAKTPGDGLDGPTAWQLTVTGGTVCGQLETLALTGADAGALLALAGLLAAAGAAVLLAVRVRMRQPE